MMARKIEISIGDSTFEGELNDTGTAEKFFELLPVSGEGSRWGDEIYVDTPLDVENEDPQREVEVGDLAYWPPGNSFCIMFGPTPSSSGDRPVLSSPGTVIGKINAAPDDLRQLQDYNIKIRSKQGGE